MIIDGRKLSQAILRDLKGQRGPIRKSLRLTAVLVGDNPESIHFLRQKERACREIGIKFRLVRYPITISRERLKNAVKKSARAPNATGIIIQLPLPKRFGDPGDILDLLPKEKDPDVLGRESFGAFAMGSERILPPVVGSIKYILARYKIRVRGKNVVVVGAGMLVGKPAAIWFMNQGATVTVLNEWTKNIVQFTRKADILVTGVGKPSLIRANMIRRGAVVFDAGYAVRNGKLVGDVDFKNVSRSAKLITSVPGGIGPMTVAMLLKNLTKLA